MFRLVIREVGVSDLGFTNSIGGFVGDKNHIQWFYRAGLCVGLSHHATATLLQSLVGQATHE